MQKKSKKAKSKQRKRKKVLVKRKERRSSASPAREVLDAIKNQYLGDTPTPPGFRPINPSQAIIEFTKPLFQLSEERRHWKTEAFFDFCRLIWDHVITVAERGEYPESSALMAKELSNVMELDENEAKETVKKMEEHFTHIFPPEIQPEHGQIMFVRQ